MPDPAVEPVHMYLTLDDEDENLVLELVRCEGETYLLRHGGQWDITDPDADNDRIWDRQIIDVTEDAAQEYDRAEQEGEQITRDRFEDYEIPDDDEEVA